MADRLLQRAKFLQSRALARHDAPSTKFSSARVSFEFSLELSDSSSSAPSAASAASASEAASRDGECDKVVTDGECRQASATEPLPSSRRADADAPGSAADLPRAADHDDGDDDDAARAASTQRVPSNCEAPSRLLAVGPAPVAELNSDPSENRVTAAAAAVPTRVQREPAIECMAVPYQSTLVMERLVPSVRACTLPRFILGKRWFGHA
jgi:hypothetical protein